MFSSVGGLVPKRAGFNLSHTKSMTMEMGSLIPILCEDLVPGDYFKVGFDSLVRLAPMLAPVMHQIEIKSYYFFVPNRLIWDGFEDFITGGRDGKDVSVPPQYVYTAPTDGTSADATSTLYDYLGLPLFNVGADDSAPSDDVPATKSIAPLNGITFSALPFRAVRLCWYEWFIDRTLEDFEESLPIDKSGGLFPITDVTGAGDNYMFALPTIRWEKDYFTSARPASQLGDDVTFSIAGNIPLTPGTAPVTADGSGSSFVTVDGDFSFTVRWRASFGQEYSSEVSFADGQVLSEGQFQVGAVLVTIPAVTSSTPSPLVLQISSAGGGNVLLSAASVSLPIQTASSAITGTADLRGVFANAASTSLFEVNDLRIAVQLKKWLERNMRCGSRYVESILSHFGVRSPDARLQRPEFIGGGRSPLTVSEVLQTSSTDSTSPQANMAGHGLAIARTHGCSYRATEHGWLVGFIVVTPRSQYSQGLPRRFSRTSRFEYLWPEFVNLGEQEVLEQELYADLPYSSDNPDALVKGSVFGFQGRYDEYRFRENSISGDFRRSLQYWTMSRYFDSAPQLNTTFIDTYVGNSSTGITKRIFADTSNTNPVWMMCRNTVKAVRPLPRIGEPGLLDHH